MANREGVEVAGARIAGARIQNLFREVNERIEELGSSDSATGEVLCECADTACVEGIALTSAEYEAVRRMPARFFVRPGHEVAAIERVVGETDRYAVVEKLGEGGTEAADLDPRRSQTREPA